LKRTIIICLIFFAACKQLTKDKDFVFIVSSFNKPTNPKEPPHSPMPEYAPINFIVDTGGQIYYYQLQLGKPKCASVNDDNLTPPFIGLQPENIVQAPQSILAAFIKNNIILLDKDYKYVSIASFTDTVKAISLKSLIDIFSDTANKITYSVRKTTQEEKIVLDFKKRQIYYDPNSVVWDSSRIRFPPKMKVPKVESGE
jgi:hypothetical protein